MAGIRTSWFEEDALYWHEGLDDWRPVGEFPVSPTNDCRHVQPGELPAAPSLPASPRGAHGPLSRERRPRSSKPASRRLGSRGRAIFLVFALLAVLLTVGALLLLMLI